jgi:hypothetical protein
VAVAITDATVTAVNQKLAALILAKLASALDRGALRIVNGRRPLAVFGLYSPFSLMGDDVLVATF